MRWGQILMSENCAGWAPGLNIPDGECIHCGTQRRDHAKIAQSRASGAIAGISSREFALADSPLASHPSMVSPASSAAKVNPDVVFCRFCNQGMVIKGADETAYQCPKCHKSGPKSKTPTGVPHGDGHERKPETQKTPTQLAFEDGVSGVNARRPDDKAYAEWYAEGKRRREADAAAVDAASGIIEGETEDVPVADVAPKETE